MGFVISADIEMYRCCQCRKRLAEDNNPVYRTFADDFGNSTGKAFRRVCPACVEENRRQTRIEVLICAAVLGLLLLFIYL